MKMKSGRSSGYLGRGRLERATNIKDHFFEEAKALLASRADRSLPTIQALALMSLGEASCGQEKISLSYALQSIGMAVESGLHMDYSAPLGSTFSCGEREVRAATFWGCFARWTSKSGMGESHGMSTTLTFH